MQYNALIQFYVGDCRRHRQEMMRRGEKWIPECDTNGRYKPMQCQPGTSPGGQKQYQCWSPFGDVLTRFENDGFGRVVNFNCFFENYWYGNREHEGYDGLIYCSVAYSRLELGERTSIMGNDVIGRNFYGLGWMPERQPIYYPDGRYLVRRFCSTDGY